MVPSFLQPYLASYDLSRLDVERDKDIIITEILNKGDDEAIIWLGRTYPKKVIKEVISFPIRGLWMKSVLDYWTKIFDIKLSRERFNRAILDLNP